MAIEKFSQITLAGTKPLSTAFFIGYDNASGNVDYAWGLSYVQAAMWASPTFTTAAQLVGSTNGNVTFNIQNNNSGGTSATSSILFTNDVGNVATCFYTNNSYNNGAGLLGNTMGFFTEGPFVVTVYDASIPASHNSLYCTVKGAVLTGIGFTVATLPTGQPTGARAYVTDASGPTFLGTLTGGGAVVCPVFFNGSAWVAG